MSLFLFITEHDWELTTFASHINGIPTISSRNYSVGSHFPLVIVLYPSADFKSSCNYVFWSLDLFSKWGIICRVNQLQDSFEPREFSKWHKINSLFKTRLFLMTWTSQHYKLCRLLIEERNPNTIKTRSSIHECLSKVECASESPGGPQMAGPHT